MWQSQNGSGKQWEMDEETLKKRQGEGSNRTESNIEHIQQMWNEKGKT